MARSACRNPRRIFSRRNAFRVLGKEGASKFVTAKLWRNIVPPCYTEKTKKKSGQQPILETQLCFAAIAAVQARLIKNARHGSTRVFGEILAFDCPNSTPDFPYQTPRPTSWPVTYHGAIRHEFWYQKTLTDASDVGKTSLLSDWA